MRVEGSLVECPRVDQDPPPHLDRKSTPILPSWACLYSNLLQAAEHKSMPDGIRPKTDRTMRISSAVATPVTTNHAVKGSVFGGSRSSGNFKYCLEYAT